MQEQTDGCELTIFVGVFELLIYVNQVIEYDLVF